jgi:hypothetical protein
MFLDDLRHAQEITAAAFRQRPWTGQTTERVAIDRFIIEHLKESARDIETL